MRAGDIKSLGGVCVRTWQKQNGPGKTPARIVQKAEYACLWIYRLGTFLEAIEVRMGGDIEGSVGSDDAAQQG